MAETPLQALEAAVQDFLRSTGADGDLHGFVLLATTSRISADLHPELAPLGWSNHYVSTASPTEALGLSQAFGRLMETVVSFDAGPDEDAS